MKCSVRLTGALSDGVKSSVFDSCLFCISQLLGLTMHWTMATRSPQKAAKLSTISHDHVRKDKYRILFYPSERLPWLCMKAFKFNPREPRSRETRTVSSCLLSTRTPGRISPSPTHHVSVCSKNFRCAQSTELRNSEGLYSLQMYPSGHT